VVSTRLSAKMCGSGTIAAMITRNAIYHAVFAIVGLLHQVAWIVRMYDRLS